MNNAQGANVFTTQAPGISDVRRQLAHGDCRPQTESFISTARIHTTRTDSWINVRCKFVGRVLCVCFRWCLYAVEYSKCAYHTVLHVWTTKWAIYILDRHQLCGGGDGVIHRLVVANAKKPKRRGEIKIMFNTQLVDRLELIKFKGIAKPHTD